MTARVYPLTLLAVAFLATFPCQCQNRVFETTVPGLYYSEACWSEIELQNLSTGERVVEIGGHLGNGALAGFRPPSGSRIRLGGGQRLRLRLETESGEGWADILETLPEGSERPSVAVTGKTECLDGNILRSAAREAAFPVRNAGFKAPVRTVWPQGDLLLVLNASSESLTLWACYSRGHLVSNEEGELTPLCSTKVEMTVPAFGSRQLTAWVGEASLVSVKTEGEAVVLQMFEPTEERLKLYRVDSKIEFGSEVK